MNRMGDEILAYAGFSEEKDRAIEGRYLLDQLHNPFQSEVTADDLITGRMSEFLMQIYVFIRKHILESDEFLMTERIGQRNGKGFIQQGQPSSVLLRVAVFPSRGKGQSPNFPAFD